MVYPNTGNQFFAGATNFTEYPMQFPFGGIHTKTDTHMATGGWLDSYQDAGSTGVRPIQDNTRVVQTNFPKNLDELKAEQKKEINYQARKQAEQLLAINNAKNKETQYQKDLKEGNVPWYEKRASFANNTPEEQVGIKGELAKLQTIKNQRSTQEKLDDASLDVLTSIVPELPLLKYIKPAASLNKGSKLLKAAPENAFTYRGVVEPFEGATKLVRDEADAYYNFLQGRQNPYLAGQWKNENKEFMRQHPLTPDSYNGIREKPSDPEYYKNFLVNGKSIPSSKELPGSPNVTSVTENITNKFNAPIVLEKPSWVLHEPQTNTLQIKSTITGSPLEKQLSKTGEINVNNIKTHIGKSEVGQQDKFIIDKVLNEKFAGKTKIDYNDFRKAVSEELVPLERNTLVDSNTNWGVSRLGYPASKKSTYNDVLKHGKEEIDRLENLLKHDGNIEPTTWETSDQIRERLKVQLTDQKLKYKNNLKEYENLPLENNSITYSNSSKFGRGSADHFDENTLGHSRTLVSKEEPDVMHILEQQSDYYQKNPLNKAEQSVKDRERILNEVLNDAEMKKVYGDDYNKLIVDSHEKNLAMAKDKLEQVQNTVYNNPNPVQKEFLGKTHQERLLQENVLHAAEQGKSKMRYPTSETAAKVQGYFKMDLSYDQHPDFKHVAEKMRYADANLSNAAAQKEAQEAYMEYQKAKEINPEKFFNYSPEHQTILKKYDDTPKMIKKVLGKEAKIVTDSKGNSWYEFDIPDAAKKGKFEIKAFALGGGLLDDEFRRGGQKRLKKYTSKNIQSSVNDIMLRNETLFGPAGKKRYKPGLKYKDGGWLDNMY
jgi:hypothetical protein